MDSNESLAISTTELITEIVSQLDEVHAPTGHPTAVPVHITWGSEYFDDGYQYVTNGEVQFVDDKGYRFDTVGVVYFSDGSDGEFSFHIAEALNPFQQPEGPTSELRYHVATGELVIDDNGFPTHAV